MRRVHAGIALVVATLLLFPLSSNAGSAPPEGYVVGPGDLLEISVWGYPDLTRVAAVSPDGVIALPLVGSISAANLQIQRLTEMLAKAYAEYIVNPRVMVTVKEYRKIHVSLLGQVTRPGSYDLPLGARLLDLLAAGGGPTDVAALKEAQFIRPGQANKSIDLTKAMAGDAALNLPLGGGETLVVPEDLTGYVTVQGQVARPGRYHLKGEMRVLDVLAIAGGLTEKAAVTEASLTHNPLEKPDATASGSHAGVTATEPLGLDALLLRQDMDRNVIVKAGDVITIPEDLASKIYIIGDVKTPGVFPLKTQVTLLQAIAMAGGPEQRGWGTAKSAYVIRRGTATPRQEMTAGAAPRPEATPGSTPRPEVTAGPARTSSLPNGATLITADLSAIMHDPSRDVAVQPGDVVVLPMSSMGAFGVLMNILTGIGYLFRF